MMPIAAAPRPVSRRTDRVVANLAQSPFGNRLGTLRGTIIVARIAPAAGLGGFLLALLRAVSSSAFIRCALLALAWAILAGTAAHAAEAVNIRTDARAIDLTDAVELQHTDGDRIQVSTAPGPDGIIRRIEVRARQGGTNWAVFSLANDGEEQIDRLIGATHYRMVCSGLVWDRRASSSSRRLRAIPRNIRTMPPPTCFASRSIPARSSPSSPNCGQP